MFTFICKPDGGETFEVEATSRAIAAWEAAPGQPKGSRRSISTLLADMRMTELVDLAWFAADRAEKTGLDLRSWRDQVDIDARRTEDDEETDDDAGPSGRGPSRG